MYKDKAWKICISSIEEGSMKAPAQESRKNVSFPCRKYRSYFCDVTKAAKNTEKGRGRRLFGMRWDCRSCKIYRQPKEIEQ